MISELSALKHRVSNIFFARLLNKVVKLVTDPIKCAVRLRRFNYLWWLGYKKKKMNHVDCTLKGAKHI